MREKTENERFFWKELFWISQAFWSLFLNLIRAKRFYETYGDLLNGLMQGGGLESMFGGGGGDLLSSLSLLNPDLFSAPFTAGDIPAFR